MLLSIVFSNTLTKQQVIQFLYLNLYILGSGRKTKDTHEKDVYRPVMTSEINLLHLTTVPVRTRSEGGNPITDVVLSEDPGTNREALIMAVNKRNL
jgi:hypothetical protein